MRGIDLGEVSRAESELLIVPTGGRTRFKGRNVPGFLPNEGVGPREWGLWTKKKQKSTYLTVNSESKPAIAIPGFGMSRSPRFG